MNNHSISFKSRFVGYTNVKKLDGNNRFVDCKSSVHELNPLSLKDIYIMDKISKNWGGEDSFAQHIDYGFTASRQYGFLRDIDRFYVITADTDKYLWPNIENVLGVVNTRFKNNNDVKVVFLQVNPKYKHNSNANIKNVGTAILNALKETYEGKEISLNAIIKTIPFYMKNGFETVGAVCEGSQLMKYKPILNKVI